MSDDLRELIARYATGNLTDAEQNLLFEAALEDEGLFEELMGEHAIRQLVQQPGVKARLIASLSKPKKIVVWRWVSVAAGAVAMLVFLLWLRSPPLRQVAEVRAPASVPSPQLEPATSSVVPNAASPAASKRVPTAKAKPETPEVAQKLKEAPAILAQLAAPQQKDAPNPVEPVKGPPTPQPQRVLAPAAARFAEQTPTTGRFAFDYEITADGRLRVTPASNGFFSVASAIGAGPQVISANQVARAEAASEFDIPPGATLIRVIFSAQPVPLEPAPAGFGGALDPPSGTKIDPNPTPNSRLTAVIPLRPR